MDRDLHNFPFNMNDDDCATGRNIDNGIIFKDYWDIGNGQNQNVLIEFLFDEFAKKENYKAIKGYIKHRDKYKGSSNYPKYKNMNIVTDVLQRAVRRVNVWKTKRYDI